MIPLSESDQIIQGRAVIARAEALAGLPRGELCGRSGKTATVYWRRAAMCAIRQQIGASYPTIAMMFGGRDHTSALLAWKYRERYQEGIDKLLEESR